MSVFRRPAGRLLPRRPLPGRRLRLESLEPRQMLATMGDAPAPYPLAEVLNNSGPRLGPTREFDDGVTFSTLRVGQLGAALTVSVTNGSNARLDGWIDFNQDGSFSGGGEQIFDAVPIGTGANQVLRFDLPAWAEEGATYLRLRIATALVPDDGLGEGGAQINGEVEDHPITILSPRAGSGNFGTARNVILQNGVVDGPMDILTGNFNRTPSNPGDTTMEIVASSHIDGEVSIFRPPLNFSPPWPRTRIYDGENNPTPGVAYALGLAAADLDGDGDLDVVSASAAENRVLWHRNDSSPSSFSFDEGLVVDGNVLGARAVAIADFDRDGRADIASVGLNDGVVRLHHNLRGTDGNPMFITHMAVSLSFNEGLADIVTGDFDNDGLIDIATVEAFTNRVVWYRNDGSPFTGVWAETQAVFNGNNTTVGNAAGVASVDIDGDGDLDLLVTFQAEGRVDWFENEGEGEFDDDRNLVDSGLDEPYPVYAADIDGDGDRDVLIPNHGDDELIWLPNDGAGGFGAVGDVIPYTSPTHAVVSDINGDGALDIVAGSESTDRIDWWENPYSPPEIVVRGASLLIEDGDSGPRLQDGTLFGSVPLGGSPITHTFTIHNTGGGILNVYGVSVPAGFALVEAPAATVNPGGQTSFEVELLTAVAGLKSGDVVIHNDDGDESEYNFRIEGTVVAPLAGDYNDDGKVDAIDFTVWRNTLGSTTDLRANGDDTGASQGRIDAADYLVWKNNYGQAASASLSAPRFTPSQEESPGPPTGSRLVARPSDLPPPYRPATRAEFAQPTPLPQWLLFRDALGSASRDDGDMTAATYERDRPSGEDRWTEAFDAALREEWGQLSPAP